MAATCPVCGFDASSLSPADAAVALRSFTRRYRSVLIPPEDDHELVDDPVRRAGASGWSALAHAAYVASAIHDTDEALRAALVRDHPGVTLPEIDPAVPPATGTVEPTLDRLKAALEGAATTVEHARGNDWVRSANAEGGRSRTVTTHDIAAHAVHLGIHHLRQAEAVLKEVVGRP